MKSSKLQTVTVFFTVTFFGALFDLRSSTGEQGDQPYLATLKKLDLEYSSYTNVLSASRELRDNLTAQFKEIPDNLKAEITGALDKRLTDLLSSLQEYRVKDYRAAMLATRLLELAGNVLELKFRPIGETPELRQKANGQYSDLSKYGKEQLETYKGSLNDSVAEIIGQAFLDVLQPVQDDAFVYGYGEPMSEVEYEQLRQIIDRTINEATEFSATLEAGSLPPSLLRDAAAIAGNGRTALRDATQRNTLRALSSDTVTSGSAKWTEKIGSLQAAINVQKREAERQEIVSIVQRTKDEAKALAEKNQASQQESTATDHSHAAGVDHSHTAHSHEGNDRATEGIFTSTGLLIATNVIVIVALALFTYLRRK